ncbi:cytidylate kinase [Paenibacillus curdlanolyticus YK9]|uniref:Cytidylate kinase n=1 Tax=Paenibacillus curdlanolyticus YK9 TaxID=717606 RepID=E0ICB0_9BACL|nr:(d)CMP kinase [Paenibacillus curdlanolyticus]EFM09796.1 cytidylate kinase [Paenibacillus curdlanolyticus YK9]
MLSQQDGGRERINIAIDGPAGAGKSTVARSVAETLGYIYIDTGAMYRAVTLSALRSGISPDDRMQLSQHAESIEISLQPSSAGQVVLLNGCDVTIDIRSREVTLNVSQVSAVERVRVRLVAMQRQLARGKGVVMDGRDIGSHVLPDAELKVYLTATVEERALRRFKELDGRDGITLEQLEHEIAERDRKDQEREISPLVCAPDAIVLDSTSMTIEQVADNIVNLSRTKLAEAK